MRRIENGGSLRRVGALLVWLCVASQAALAEPTKHLSFEIEVNGVKRTVAEGELAELVLPEATKSAKVTIRRAAQQRYEFNSIHFLYDTALSIDDDKDDDTRTVTLIDARGFSIVISDLGPPDSTSVEQLTKRMTDDLLGIFSKDPITDVKRVEPAPFTATKMSGMSAAIEYTDSDGDRNFSQIYVFRNKARDFSVIVNYTSENIADAKRSAETVINSVIAGESTV